MANEYRLHSTHVEVVRAAPVSSAQLAVAYVEVIRTVTSVASSGRRKQAMVGSF